MLLTSTLVALGLAALAPANPDTTCVVQNPEQVPVKGRQSPLDSLSFTVATQTVKVCYGRPSARGRTMIGGEGVPYGKLWRTGANEPTVIFTPVALEIAGVKVPPGKYSLYSVPGEKEWQIIVNRATSQWGHESQYTKAVEAQEVGRGKVTAEKLSAPVETFTISPDPASGETRRLVLTWETTSVAVPIKAAGKV